MARPENEPKTPLGRRLRDIREHFKIDDRPTFAEKLGVSVGALAYYERGERVPDASVLALYRERFGINISWLVTGLGEMFDDASKGPVQFVPVDQKTIQKLVDSIDEVREATVKPWKLPPRSEPRPEKTIKYFPGVAVSAGAGLAAMYESPGADLDLTRFVSELLGLDPERVFIYPIIGDSMLPTLASGDFVVVNSRPIKFVDLQEGELYVVSYDGSLYAKRAHWPDEGDDTGFIWKSDNEASGFVPIRVPEADLNSMTVLGKVVWAFHAL